MHFRNSWDVHVHARLAFAVTQSSATSTGSRGTLYLVATPIGNLEDITRRALRILKEVSAIACEDTRHTQKLLNFYGIQNRLVSYHEHNEAARAEELLRELERGASLALVSDAGTPVVSDPGHRLISLCAARGIHVVPIPGPAAALAALMASGLPAEKFLFVGFLPARQGERRRALTALANFPYTLIFFEAPHRIAATLADAAEILGLRPAVLAREITKLHEEFLRGSLADLERRLKTSAARGEITLVVGPPVEEPKLPSRHATLSGRVAELISGEHLDRKAALKQAAREFGLNRRDAYKKFLIEEAGPAKRR